MSADRPLVEAETPMGDTVLAHVVDRETSGSIGTGPEDILTLQVGEHTFRAEESDVERVD